MSCQTRWSFWRPLNDTRRFLELKTLPNGFVNESNQHSQRKLLFICYQGLIQIYLSSQPVVILKSMAMSNSGRCVSQPASQLWDHRLCFVTLDPGQRNVPLSRPSWTWNWHEAVLLSLNLTTYAHSGFRSLLNAQFVNYTIAENRSMNDKTWLPITRIYPHTQ